MTHTTVGQRLKILIESLNLDVRTFSQALDVAETTTRNYLNRGTKPGTGNGEPLLTGGDSQVSHIKNNYGNSVGSNNKGGTVTQHHGGATSPSERDTKLALAEKEIQHLREQLAAKDALLASKDETIAVLKTAFNRPN